MKLMLAAVLVGPLAIQPVFAQTTPPHSPIVNGTRLDINARGEVRRVPDIAVINAGVVTNSADAATAMAEIAVRMSRIFAALRKAGVADKDITTASVSLSPQYRYVENQPPVITGYQAGNSLMIRFRDIGKSGAILDALVKQGANQIGGPSLVVEKTEAAQDEARVAAIKVARARAELYANAAGMKVRRIISISESDGYSGGPAPLMAMSRMEDSSAKTEVAPGEQEIGVNVAVVFELQ